MDRLDIDIASQLAQLTLGHVRREYPHSESFRSQNVDDQPGAPGDNHPIFYGSYDWHSCVHGHWLLARLLRRFPGLPEAGHIQALFDQSYTADKVAAELAFFQRPGRAGFERPYGWCWLLKLFAELAQLEDQRSGGWRDQLQPLVYEIADRLQMYLPRLLYPIRSGTHSNTAFALLLALDYASQFDSSLAELLKAQARQYYLNDVGYQGWEPGGEDFLSPGWQEALLMKEALGVEFAEWFEAFLPELAAGRPAQLLIPVEVSDRSDGRLAHLDGLNLSRAWCQRQVLSALPASYAARDTIQASATSHLQAGAAHLQDDYMGEHWLATFLVLAFDGL
ncbi:Protein of unknown function [Halopseudomonas xinjiangensis]|uniref:DUF2891 domain-containing protein n=1 Tax=Halopseudomonas xinjiangensis TaxID=487184 RepID=A0A1H1LF20_9GAMM|nr:DUF2891 domain-containing protein [Halopseudomonas xinjiangensis]SDR73093.1 Protein of unknown function [Halopseudomonas xinjiangensis]